MKLFPHTSDRRRARLGMRTVLGRCVAGQGRGPRKRGAFTMIEILLAIAILGMILTAIYSSWTAILKAADTGNRAAAIAQRERTTRRIIEDALSSVQYFTENQNYYAFVADTTDDRFAHLSIVSRLPSSFPGNGLFSGGPRRVTFFVRPGANGQNELAMSQELLLIPTNLIEKPYTLKLADNVNQFSLEFWDTNVNDWATEWLNTNQLPQIVRVGLSFGTPGRRSEPGDIVSTVVSLSASAITREMQVPDGQAGRSRNNQLRTNQLNNNLNNQQNRNLQNGNQFNNIRR